MTSSDIRTSVIDVSVVMPCLNEAETLAQCLRTAATALTDGGLRGELIVADNGSTDGSIEIAATNGARVVHVGQKGYGAAVQGGIAAARGEYVIMGDADASYDFGTIPAFVEELRGGADVVMGNRFRGGTDAGAMPFAHRYLGNPVLSTLGRLFYRSNIGDFHCGIRGFTKSAYERMQLVTAGMEFASEMIVKASLLGMTITEIPVSLRKDGRSRPPHLRTWRDGWRHLRFLLLYSPRWLFLFPGLLLLGMGLLGSALLVWRPVRVGAVVFDIHALLIFGCMCILGYQVVLFAVFTKVFVVREGLHPPSRTLDRLFRYINLEVGLAAGALTTLGGVVLLGGALVHWGLNHFSELDPRQTMRLVIPAVVFVVLGVQTIFGSFFLSILGLRQMEHPFDTAAAVADTHW